MIQVINAQVSLGSHPQNLPQALSAQIAPEITAKVQNGKANKITLYEISSILFVLGRFLNFTLFLNKNKID